jgi:uncharacterized membrane protein
LNAQQQIDQNIEAMRDIERRVDRSLDPATVRFQKLASRLGQPFFLRFALAFIGLWVAVNLMLPLIQAHAFDPFPFFTLQGIVSLSALVTSLVVLIGQNRESTLESQRTHVHLQVSILAEQKITKLISLVEELRRDLPSVSNRHDQEAEAMQLATDPQALIERLEPSEIQTHDK